MIPIELPYGKGKQILHVDPARLKAVIEPHAQTGGVPDETAIVREALENPIASLLFYL